MAKTKTFRHANGELSDAGARIRARRAFLGKSRPDIEKETNKVLYEKLQARVERGEKKVGNLYTRHLLAYLKVLEWTPADLERETGVTVPEGDPSPTPGSEAFNPAIGVPFQGEVGAGLQELDLDDAGHMIGLDPIFPGLAGRKKERLGIVRVNGDSMVSEVASQSVPKGSMLVVEWGAIPSPGSLVVAWLAEHETAVLKQYQEAQSGSDVVLKSYNPRGPVFRATDDVDVRGVVRTIVRPGPG